MIGGFTGRPLANSTGPGTPIPMPRTSPASRPVSLEQLGEALRRPAEHRLGTAAMAMSAAVSASGVPARSRHGDARVGRAEVGDEHDAGRRG